MALSPSSRVQQWLMRETSDTWLSCLRIGLALTVACYTLSLLRDWHSLLSDEPGSLATRPLAEAMLSAASCAIPRIGWPIALGKYLDIDQSTTLNLAWAALLLSSLLLGLGIWSRTSACLAWLLHLAAAKSSTFFSYGVDNMITIGLFYLALSPLPDRLALDSSPGRLAPEDKSPSLVRRALQLHLCLVYFFGGVSKSLGPDWWNGQSIWAALTRPPFDVLNRDLIYQWRALLPVLGIGVCVIELGYCIFIWPQRTRRIWLAVTIAMHLGIGLVMGMYLFALVMIALNLAAFSSFEWKARFHARPFFRAHLSDS